MSEIRHFSEKVRLTFLKVSLTFLKVSFTFFEVSEFLHFGVR